VDEPQSPRTRSPPDLELFFLFWSLAGSFGDSFDIVNLLPSFSPSGNRRCSCADVDFLVVLPVQRRPRFFLFSKIPIGDYSVSRRTPPLAEMGVLSSSFFFYLMAPLFPFAKLWTAMSSVLLPIFFFFFFSLPPIVGEFVPRRICGRVLDTSMVLVEYLTCRFVH